MSIPEPRRTTKMHGQQGVVLIVALIMLMILTVLASISIRGASSTEQVANQSRQQALARQTAEAALRFCEQQVQLFALNPATGFAPEAAPLGAGTPYSWQTMGNWDTLTPTVNLKTVPVASSGDAGTNVYFTRQPECMAQYLTPADTKVFVTTARGFGPEVGAKDGSAPKGTEVWLQSVITMK
ncbi:MAG: PilX N-terminal domain-containing pilus assembly protein [Polaromonas sp.]|nr:PilX N-terminal domain-containing pilus assembly protein [Polaromonas sp.]